MGAKRKSKPAAKCTGCELYQKHQCDILGQVTEEIMKVCAKRGYRRQRYQRLVANRRAPRFPVCE